MRLPIKSDADCCESVLSKAERSLPAFICRSACCSADDKLLLFPDAPFAAGVAVPLLAVATVLSEVTPATLDAVLVAAGVVETG